MENFQEKVYKNLGEIDQDIVYLEQNQPDKRTKEFKEWVKDINYLFSLYNKMAGSKIYKLL